MDLAQQESEFVEEWDRLAKIAKDILLQKRAMRGTSNITRQGFMGVVTRMAEDKLARIQKAAEDVFLREKLKVRGVTNSDIDRLIPDPLGQNSGEGRISLEDDLIDTANYCFIAVLLLRGKWELK